MCVPETRSGDNSWDLLTNDRRSGCPPPLQNLPGCPPCSQTSAGLLDQMPLMRYLEILQMKSIRLSNRRRKPPPDSTGRRPRRLAGMPRRDRSSPTGKHRQFSECSEHHHCGKGTCVEAEALGPDRRSVSSPRKCWVDHARTAEVRARACAFQARALRCGREVLSCYLGRSACHCESALRESAQSAGMDVCGVHICVHGVRRKQAYSCESILVVLLLFYFPHEQL